MHLCKAFKAIMALKRLFPGMYPFMVNQVLCAAKSFSAVSARERVVLIRTMQQFIVFAVKA